MADAIFGASGDGAPASPAALVSATALPARQIIFDRAELELWAGAIKTTIGERDALRHEVNFLRSVLAATSPDWEKLQ